MNRGDASAGQSCQICGTDASSSRLVMARSVRPAVGELIHRDYPDWDENGYICEDDLSRYRYQYVQRLVLEEKGELSDLEKEVLASISRHEILASHVDEEFEAAATFGQRLSDDIARFGGSWTFILLFAVVLLGWIGVNSLTLLTKPFDPYPYIFLNLLLSCLAAIQAPVIMMSQNRQEAKDRSRSAHDYQVNLKAELEIRQLHQKLDHLLSHQWERLVAIQQVQIELLDELRRLPGGKDHAP